MRLLNLHENIYISNESDLVWILYQLFNNQEPKPYKWDAAKGFHLTRGTYLDKLNPNSSVEENFISILKHMMKDGFNSIDPMNKKDVTCFGDQKMFQHADPDVMPFILKNFAEPKFIHLIRHPYHVVRSSLKFAEETGAKSDDNIWRNMSITQIEERWVMHEKWVLDAKAKYKINCIDVLYEDLVLNTATELRRINRFLGVSSTTDYLKKCELTKYVRIKPTKRFDLSIEAKKIIGTYGLEKFNFLYTDRPLIIRLINLFFGFKRWLARYTN